MLFKITFYIYVCNRKLTELDLYIYMYICWQKRMRRTMKFMYSALSQKYTWMPRLVRSLRPASRHRPVMYSIGKAGKHKYNARSLPCVCVSVWDTPRSITTRARCTTHIVGLRDTLFRFYCVSPLLWSFVCRYTFNTPEWNIFFILCGYSKSKKNRENYKNNVAYSQ